MDNRGCVTGNGGNFRAFRRKIGIRREYVTTVIPITIVYRMQDGRSLIFSEIPVLRFMSWMVWVKIASITGAGWLPASGSECRLCDFCAFSQPAILQVHVAVKMPLFLQIAQCGIFSTGVDTPFQCRIFSPGPLPGLSDVETPCGE